MAVTGRVWRDGLARELAPDDEVVALIHEPGALVWIDLCDPDQEELSRLGRELGLDPHTLEDSLAPRERPKATRFESYTFSTVYSASLGAEAGGRARLQLGRISAYALPTALLTVRHSGAFDAGPVVQRWAEDAELVAFGVDGLLQGLLDVVVDGHFEVLELIDDQLEDLVAQLFADRPDLRDLQRRTFAIRAELVGLRRIVPPLRDVVATLIRAGQFSRGWPAGLLSYYEDLNDHVLRASEWSESLRELVSSVYETNLALNDTRMNEVMKKLAAVAAIIAVPTLITGWFGMNVPYWGFGAVGGFVAAGSLVIVVVVTLFLVFRKQGWL